MFTPGTSAIMRSSGRATLRVPAAVRANSYGYGYGQRTLRAGVQRPEPQQRPGQSWYRIENLVSTQDGQTTAAVYLYDEIGLWGITAQDFVRDLLQVTANDIHLHINSPGGDVFDGVAIYNALRAHPANVTVHVDGLAASAASFIAQAGDRRLIARNAQMMIHDAQGVCMGNASDMAEMAALLDKASDNIADIYATVCGGTKKSWRKEMQQTVWYSADEAAAAGLVDQVEDVSARTGNRAAPAVVVSQREAPEVVEPLPPPTTNGSVPEDAPVPAGVPVVREVSSDAAVEAGQFTPPPIDVSLFRAAVDAALDPHPDFDAGDFRVLMASVAQDAPAPPTPVIVATQASPVVAPVPEPEPEPVVGPNPQFDSTRFQTLMASVALDAPAPPTPVTPPTEPDPEPEQEPEPEPEPVVGPHPGFDADAFQTLMGGIAQDAPAPPTATLSVPAQEQPLVVQQHVEAQPSTQQVLADYLRAVLTDAANDLPALPSPPQQTPVPPPPVQVLDRLEFERSLREAL